MLLCILIKLITVLCTLTNHHVVPAWGQVGRRRVSRPSLSYPRPPQRSSDKMTPPKTSHVTELHGGAGGRNLREMRDRVYLLYMLYSFTVHNLISYPPD